MAAFTLDFDSDTHTLYSPRHLTVEGVLIIFGFFFLFFFDGTNDMYKYVHLLLASLPWTYTSPCRLSSHFVWSTQLCLFDYLE